MAKDDRPKYALVVWPFAYDRRLPECIVLEAVEDALAKGAVLIAREDAELIPGPFPGPSQSNPRRVEDEGDGA